MQIVLKICNYFSDLKTSLTTLRIGNGWYIKKDNLVVAIAKSNSFDR